MTPEMIKEFETNLADIELNLAQMEAAIAPCEHCTTVEGQPYIVLDQYGQACTFNVVPMPGKKKQWYATCTGQGWPHKVNRWDEKSARTLADAVGGQVMPWRTATRHHVDLTYTTVVKLRAILEQARA